MLNERYRSVVGFLLLPALVGGVVAATQALAATGLPSPALAAPVLITVVLTVLLLERLSPLHRAWNAAPERTDLLLLVGNRIIDVAVVAATLVVLGKLRAALPGLATWQPWPTSLPLFAQAALGISVAEFVRYVMHRLSHRQGWLGRVHATHHEPQRMYALNGPRLHPGNQLWIAVANTVPMLALGAPLAAVILAANITVLFVVLQHSNIALRFPLWNAMLATPDVHRLHHLREQRGVGVNYGIVLLIYDRVFGTYERAGADVQVHAIGDPTVGCS